VNEKGENKTCIYCGEAVGTHKGDHVIPAVLGEFEDDTLFTGICETCNNRMSKLDEQVLRCGPESLLRSILNPDSKRARRKGRKKSNSFRPAVGASGTPPPLILVEDPEWGTLLVKRTGEEETERVEQLIIKTEEGKQRHIPIFPDMRPDQLRELIAKDNLPTDTEWASVIDMVNAEKYEKLLWDAFEKRITFTAEQEAGRTMLTHYGICAMSDEYFRGVAKIGFHYMLTTWACRFVGSEPEFEGIRNYIINGGKSAEFVASDQRYFTRYYSPKGWNHFLALKEINGVITAYVTLFWKGGYPSIEHKINIGSRSTSLIYDAAVAHAYLYEDPLPSGRIKGSKEPIELQPFHLFTAKLQP